MSVGIDALLERVDADAAIAVEKAFVFLSMRDVDLEDLLDDVGHRSRARTKVR